MIYHILGARVVSGGRKGENLEKGGTIFVNVWNLGFSFPCDVHELLKQLENLKKKKN